LGKEPELRKPEGKVKPTQKYNVAESQILDLDESNFIEKPTPLVKPDKNGSLQKSLSGKWMPSMKSISRSITSEISIGTISEELN
jgi:hypothetical protein